jgi:hypothetical protein
MDNNNDNTRIDNTIDSIVKNQNISLKEKKILIKDILKSLKMNNDDIKEIQNTLFNPNKVDLTMDKEFEQTVKIFLFLGYYILWVASFPMHWYVFQSVFNIIVIFFCIEYIIPKVWYGKWYFYLILGFALANYFFLNRFVPVDNFTISLIIPYLLLKKLDYIMGARIKKQSETIAL